MCFLQLSPPDEHGYCSYGVSNECSKTAAEHAKIIIAQINHQMPRVLGDNFIHISKIDFIVETGFGYHIFPAADLQNIIKSKNWRTYCFID